MKTDKEGTKKGINDDEKEWKETKLKGKRKIISKEEMTNSKK